MISNDYNIKIHNIDNKYQVILDGEFDLYNSEDLKDKLLNLVDKKALEIELNLEKVGFLDSTTLGIFILINNKLQQDKSALKIICNENNYKLFKVSGLDKWLEISVS